MNGRPNQQNRHTNAKDFEKSPQISISIPISNFIIIITGPFGIVLEQKNKDQAEGTNLHFQSKNEK